MSRTEVDGDIPVSTVRTLLGDGRCANGGDCRWHQDEMRTKLLGRYLAVDAPQPGQLAAARIGLAGLDWATCESRLRECSKGSAVRDANRADREGFGCAVFPRDLHVPDLVDINRSKDVRSGGPMRGHYTWTVEEQGGAPTVEAPLELPMCPLHYDLWWGVFEPHDGWRQGAVRTDKRLVGYIRLRRNGEYALYSQLLGHGDYLRYGIMYHLHFTVLRWLVEPTMEHARGITELVYGAWESGGPGLQRWKKKNLFGPAYLRLGTDGEDEG